MALVELTIFGITLILFSAAMLGFFTAYGVGANDVANAIGPFMAIYMISKEGAVDKENDFGSDAYLFLLLGGVGISVGLLLYGYKILHGVDLNENDE